ncbi:MAG: hypothetical protein V2J55_11565 [Candidatus Competibacteraceae bacterium]|jgi:uncharacterized membrane protein|nr:hypothetical protein [Candidatus Competibacteraceae bacterium]
MTELKMVAVGFVLLTLAVLFVSAPINKPRIKRWFIMGLGIVPGFVAVVTGFIMFVTSPDSKLA